MTTKIIIDLDLASIITAAVSIKRIQPLVDTAIMTCIKRAIEDATGYRSAFSDSLKKQLTDALPHGLSIKDTAKFQQVLNASLTNAVHTANDATIQTALRKAVDQVIPNVPSSIALSEFMKVVREGLHKEDNEDFFAQLELSDYGYGVLFFDQDNSSTSKYGSDFRIAFNNEGHVYAMKMCGKDMTPSSFPNVVSAMDSLMMSMYVGRTTLIVDISADDVTASARSSEDY